MFIYALIVALQIYCIWHVIHYHRSKGWICLILFAPFIGSAVYMLTEVVPLQNSRQRNQRYRPVKSNITPMRYRPAGKTLEHLQEEVKFSHTTQNLENLADEYARQGLYSEAMSTYRDCLSGQQENNPALLYKLAEAAFGQGDLDLTIKSLHKVRATSDYRPAKVRLLLARAYEASGQADKAEATYEQVLKVHSELEIKCRYAAFLQNQGQFERAKVLLEEVQDSGKRMPAHAVKLNRVWLDFAAKQARKHTADPV